MYMYTDRPVDRSEQRPEQAKQLDGAGQNEVLSFLLHRNTLLAVPTAATGFPDRQHTYTGNDTIEPFPGSIHF